MRPAFMKIGAAPALLALVMITQFHWSALQVIAWSGMLVTYSARAGIEVGIRETFDGEHPCPMCSAIKAAKERAQNTHHLSALSPTSRLLAIPCVAAVECPPVRPTFDLSSHEAAPPCAGRHPPPVPPPRRITA